MALAVALVVSGEAVKVASCRQMMATLGAVLAVVDDASVLHEDDEVQARVPVDHGIYTGSKLQSDYRTEQLDIFYLVETTCR